MKGTDPKRQMSRQVARQHGRKMAGPPLKITVIGDGWMHQLGRPAMVQNKVFHREYWSAPDKNGMSFNNVPKRKSMRKFPDLEPIQSRPE